MIALQTDQTPSHADSEGSPSIRSLNVIELGCGCGMVGICLTQLLPTCNVLLTDMPEAEEIVCRNLAVMNPLPSSRAVFMTLDWEAPLPEAIKDQKFDLVIVSECTYNTDTIPALVQTLSALNSQSPNAAVLLSTKVRHSSESMFLDLIRKTNLVESGHTELSLPRDASSNEEPEIVHVYVFQDKEVHRSILSTRDGKPFIEILSIE